MYDSNGNYLEDIVPSDSGGLQTPNAVVVRETNTEPGFEINSAMSDAWYNPATDGQGFLITVFPGIKLVFLAWFTFDSERPPEDVSAISSGYLTRQSFKGFTHFRRRLDQFDQHTLPSDREVFAGFGVDETDVEAGCPLADSAGRKTHTPCL
jgi:hypothetical protein